MELSQACIEIDLRPDGDRLPALISVEEGIELRVIMQKPSVAIHLRSAAVFLIPPREFGYTRVISGIF
jgi:hypothetical protein